MTDQHARRTPHARILVYMAVLAFVLAVLFHVIGDGYRAWWASVVGGFALVLAALLTVGDRLVSRYLIGDSNAE